MQRAVVTQGRFTGQGGMWEGTPRQAGCQGGEVVAIRGTVQYNRDMGTAAEH